MISSDDREFNRCGNWDPDRFDKKKKKQTNVTFFTPFEGYPLKYLCIFVYLTSKNIYVH